jgi:hypothetical protein
MIHIGIFDRKHSLTTHIRVVVHAVPHIRRVTVRSRSHHHLGVLKHLLVLLIAAVVKPFFIVFFYVEEPFFHEAFFDIKSDYFHLSDSDLTVSFLIF